MATPLLLGLAIGLIAAGLAAAMARPHGLSGLVATQLGYLGGALAVILLLGSEGRALAIAAAVAAGVHGRLALALRRPDAASADTEVDADADGDADESAT